MGTIDEITREISVLIPKIIRGAQVALPAASSLTMPQFMILLGLHDAGPVSVTEIARLRNVSPPTVTRLVDRLIAAHLVERQEDLHDRRRVIVGLTPEGQEAVHSFQQTICERWRTILVHMTSEQQEAFLQGIRSAAAVLAQVEAGQVPICLEAQQHLHDSRATNAPASRAAGAPRPQRKGGRK